MPAEVPRARVVNKVDLLPQPRALPQAEPRETVLAVSARTGEGMEALRAWLLATAGWKPHGEGIFMARQRHLQALEAARAHLANAGAHRQAFDLQAEELRLAHRELGRITGAVSADDLLGEIFGRFCIGK